MGSMGPLSWLPCVPSWLPYRIHSDGTFQHSTACSFINLIKSLHSQQPLMAERTWFFFTHVFSCSVRALPTYQSRADPGMSGRSSLERSPQNVLVWDCLGQRCLIWNHPMRFSRMSPTIQKLRKSSYVVFCPNVRGESH